MNDYIIKLLNSLKSSKTSAIAVIAIAGMILIAANFMFSGKSAQSSSDSAFNETEYIESLEKRISEMVSEIKGAGASSVVINIVSTTESVYVKENKKSSDSSSDTSKTETEDSVLTMKDSSGNEYALVTKQILPQIGGVTVVCKGGDDPSVKAAVIDAVCTVLNIGSNKVCVIAKAN